MQDIESSFFFLFARINAGQDFCIFLSILAECTGYFVSIKFSVARNWSGVGNRENCGKETVDIVNIVSYWGFICWFVAFLCF